MDNNAMVEGVADMTAEALLSHLLQIEVELTELARQHRSLAMSEMRELKACPREPTQEMLMAGRNQIFADMTGEHMGPNCERAWKAMFDAAPDPRTLSISLDQEGLVEKVARAIYEIDPMLEFWDRPGGPPGNGFVSWDRLKPLQKETVLKMARAALLAIREGE